MQVYQLIIEIQDEKYDEEEFEEFVENFIDIVKPDQVKEIIQEIKLKLQIKKIKHNMAFKYIMRGLINAETGKKLKVISIQKFAS